MESPRDTDLSALSRDGPEIDDDLWATMMCVDWQAFLLFAIERWMVACGAMADDRGGSPVDWLNEISPPPHTRTLYSTIPLPSVEDLTDSRPWSGAYGSVPSSSSSVPSSPILNERRFPTPGPIVQSSSRVFLTDDDPLTIIFDEYGQAHWVLRNTLPGASSPIALTPSSFESKLLSRPYYVLPRGVTVETGIEVCPIPEDYISSP